MKRGSTKARVDREDAEHERVRQLSYAAVADGLRFPPEELLELLFIVAEASESHRESLIRTIAEETYPESEAGSAGIRQMIERARKEGAR